MSIMRRRSGVLLRAAPLALLLPGCLINTDLYHRRLEELTDNDDDGYNEDDGDCDDSNPAVNPGADELCNSFDDNCDGRIDEADPTNDVAWRADGDGDGFADDATVATPACTSPGEGWTSEAGDCDDHNTEIWPGAPELCDGVDNDCDGAADEEPSTDPPTWYHDADGDGFGRLDGAVTQCAAPSEQGWTLEGTDCDDTNALTYPGADEQCDGEDNDCDGAIDDPPVASGGWYPDVDHDGYGDEGAGSCSSVDGYTEVGGDCDDSDAGVNPDATEVCNDGADNDCDGTPGDCVWPLSVDMTDWITISPVNQNETLGSAGSSGDFNGDGINEVVVSAALAWATDGSEQPGAAYLFEGPITASVDTQQATMTWWGDGEHFAAGASIVVHDLNGDGFDDLQVGAPNRTVGGVVWAGSLYTLYGPLEDDGALEEVYDWRLNGSTYNDSVGYRSYSVGDLDGDGLPDFGTGYEFIDYGADRTGAVWIFTTAGTGTTTADDEATAFIYGSDAYDEIGLGFTGLDLDGDGTGDLVVGGQNVETGSVSGAALVFLGPVVGTIAGNDADLYFSGETDGGYAGRKVDALGDINGDGLEDLLVGAPYTNNKGAAYVIWGAPDIDTKSLSDADVKIRGDRANQYLGYSVQRLDDLNQDGWPDLFLSENHADAWGYVFFGPLSTTATFQASDADVILTGDAGTDFTYESAFTPGDFTGDGVADLFVGSYKYGVDWDGIVYLIPGVGY